MKPNYYENDPNDANQWTKLADEGDGQFAIAVGLLEVAAAIRAASPVDAIVLLSDNLSTSMSEVASAIEGLGNSAIESALSGMSSALGEIAGAIDPSGTRYDVFVGKTKTGDGEEKAANA